MIEKFKTYFALSNLKVGHQVLEALDTDEAKNRSKIAKIHEPGMLYQGKIIKKATITAYK